MANKFACTEYGKAKTMTKHQHHSYDLRIQPLSPLHIGSGEELTSTGEYFADDSSVYLLDNDALMRHLAQEGLLRDYIGRIDAAGNQLNFDSELAELFATDVQTMRGRLKAEFARHELRFNSGDLYRAGANDIMRRCVRTRGNAYIPGSSVKGMIRTAVVAERLRADRPEMRRFDEYIDDCIREKSERPIARNWAEFERRFATPYKQLPDFLRVSDSPAVADSEVVVEQVVRQNFYGENTAGLDWLCECIAPEAEVAMQLTVYQSDRVGDDLLRGNVRQNLFKILNAHSLRLIEIDIGLLEVTSAVPQLKSSLIERLTDYRDRIRQSDNEYAIARLGQGKSLHYQTIAALIGDRAKRDTFMQIISRRVDSERRIVPRSRSLTAHDRMLGWVKIAAPPKPVIALPAHRLERIEVGQILPRVLVTGKKRVSFVLNDLQRDNIALHVDKKRGFAIPDTDTFVKVVIKEMAKDGRITQVTMI